jgi:YegS/Rv2252/BmrU family lipid kinase
VTARRTLFIVNPVAGARRGRKRWERFTRELREESTPFDEVITARAGEAMQTAHDRAGDYEVMVAVGGDGTAFEVASGVLSAANGRAALAVVPVGTGNDIARALGIRSLSDARQALTRGRLESIDVIRIECRVDAQAAVRHALLFAGVGIAGESLRLTTPTVKNVFGERLAYPAGLLRALWSYRAPLLRVAHDAQNGEGRFLFVCASNGEWAGGGMKLAPGARMDDGVLNINLIGALGRLEALKLLRRVCQGRHTDHPKVRYLMASELKVESDEALEVAADGELVGYTPARFVVRPKALKVVRDK